jgi:hypothetical protein
MENPEALKTMARQAGILGRPNAVEVIVDNLIGMIRA